MPHTILVAHSWKLLTDHRSNGDALFAWDLVRRLAERGHRLHVACRSVDLVDAPPPGVHLHPIAAGDGDLSPRERIRFTRRLRSLYDRLSACEPIDLVHQTNPVEVGISLGLPRGGPPVVLGPYWADWPGANGRLSGASRRALRTVQQRRARAILVTTVAARAKVHARRAPVTLIPPGVDLGRFPAPDDEPPGRPPTAIFLANLRAHKGIFTLLDAFEAVVERLPEARLIVAGSGPDEERVRRRIAASPAAARIDMIGGVARDAVPETLRRADVSCQPAYGEPFGWSAVEAMACGLPVVVTDAGGLGSVVPDGAGLKVPVADAAALASALERLLRDPALRARMGAEGRRVVARDYEWEGIIDRLERVYAEAVLASRR